MIGKINVMSNENRYFECGSTHKTKLVLVFGLASPVLQSHAVFYLIILVFQISMTSAPTACVIMYVQLIVITPDFANESELPAKLMFGERGDLKLDIKVMFTLYGVLNLDFFCYILPPFCISSQIKSIHVGFLGYISALYPILLIILTWVCVELHGQNFRPLVWLWRPFHRCFA